MQIEILSVKVITVPTAKGSYQKAEVAFKNLTFQGKVEGKSIMSFGATAEAFKTLAVAQSGDVYEVSIVKNDKGYNDWVSMSKGAAPAATPASGPTPTGAAPATTNASPRSTYETPEERAKKQIYIVRQSSISNAVDILSVGSKASPKIEDVLNVAAQLEDFVFNGLPKEAMTAEQALLAMEDSVL